MTFQYQEHAFWGVLVPHSSAGLTFQKLVGETDRVPHRPRLVARWVRGNDGRLERRWYPTTLPLPRSN
jgi:hypothetical protein